MFERFISTIRNPSEQDHFGASKSGDRGMVLPDQNKASRPVVPKSLVPTGLVLKVYPHDEINKCR